MHIYDVVKRPVVTEKTMWDAQIDNKYTFEVDMKANKMMVKDAVEMAFEVSVDRVNIMVMPAKTLTRGRRARVRKPKWKKAVVTLAQGSSIQLFEGV